MNTTVLREMVAANRADGSRGIYSVCSANRLVIESAIGQALADGSPLLIEATCNQVNHQGGYTGMRPADFRNYVRASAAQLGLPDGRLILGGDHLGPNPWRNLPANEALAHAQTMVTEYVRAGFGKIHLDTSMACAGDQKALPDELIAERAADLCAAAEAAADPASLPVYVIGTEVPVPGGAHEGMDDLPATRVEDLARTIETQRRAFATRGLQSAWERVIAVVVQPGVEFDHATVIDYRPEKAARLSRAILDYQGLVFEAHSTDYQTEAALARLVADHFGILKVGPGLTYAAREALFALSYIEDEWIAPEPKSDLRAVLDLQMRAQPEHWDAYYTGSEAERAFARKYSLSDRSRYYWTDPQIEASVRNLFDNLLRRPPPLALLSQFMPEQHRAVREGRLANDPRALARHRIAQALSQCARACGLSAVERGTYHREGGSHGKH